ncbi:hypothetical protein GUITHDRAFT_85440 [Guillardia theta CCMP2712]|uniref:ABC transporter domain-containing protein n=2 Tax=Guillardia theta TaxID=55529 RepID=L1JQD0_GUITC|nr:hypothetical protein GUITHDRAFT_85440 [Guillardia theta CCMP2712]EKX50273.1 hypothetical protein GUITHDRAFT_85440 [Guillardia theta CCMP2712]|eukprot:XP_005837253.1 hypothetical protein GUITHDRAFT_85440 [Guillardia theta CCMP2712]
MTGREHLVLCAELAGLKGATAQNIATSLLQEFGIAEWADKCVKTYSGGTRRKLCAALSMVGDPSILLLDEPSTGVDPISKRRMWDFFRSRLPGRTILLTTHSMAEAEAISTRVAIMSKGSLRCIGSVQSLKSRFGRGLVLQVKLPAASRALLRMRLEELLREKLPAAEVKEEEQEQEQGASSSSKMLSSGSSSNNTNSIFTLHVQMKEQATEPSTQMPLADLFAAMETWKEEMNIEDYCISQVSLEQVFLKVTQTSEDGAVSSLPLPPPPPGSS